MSGDAFVLGVRLWPGTRQIRFTLADRTTWQGRVLWIDEATATEPLQLVLTDKRDGSTRVLTDKDTYWQLDDVIVETVEVIKKPKRTPRTDSGTGLEELLRL